MERPGCIAAGRTHVARMWTKIQLAFTNARVMHGRASGGRVRVRAGRLGVGLSLLALLGACGGGGGGGSRTSGTVTAPPTSAAPAPAPSPTPAPTPTATTAGCSVRERQDWVAAQINEWYLFPDLLATGLNPAAYATVDAYIDALTANARTLNRDRYFTYLTSIAEESAYYASGATAGFGVRFGFSGDRLFVIEAFEGGPALAAGVDRGAEIVGVGTTSANVRSVAAILASEGEAGLGTALGPATEGTVRVLRVQDATGTREVSITKRIFDLTPVSSRYGARILDDGGRRVGYLNLRTFISTADQALRNAFQQFRDAGVTNLVIDFRYNGGGLVSTAELLSDLLGGARTASNIQSITAFRPSKSAQNETRYYRAQPQSVAPMRIAFIGSGGTASASELVINSTLPYLRANSALIGTNTYGKPVGQIALDRPACDDRLRVVAFASQNADGQGGYYNGLASVMESSCQASDDISFPLGDPREASVRTALDFLAGRSCTRIAVGTQGPQAARSTTARRLFSPTRPTAAQRETPGLF